MTDIIERGEAARRILENPLFIEMKTRLAKDIFGKWCREEDEKKREALWYEQKAVDGLEKRFKALMQDAEIETHKAKMAEPKNG